MRDRQEPREEQGSYSELDREGRPLGRVKRDGQTDRQGSGGQERGGAEEQRGERVEQ